MLIWGRCEAKVGRAGENTLSLPHTVLRLGNLGKACSNLSHFTAEAGGSHAKADLRNLASPLVRRLKTNPQYSSGYYPVFLFVSSGLGKS